VPTYAYACDACGARYERFQAMSAPHGPCEACGAAFGANGARQDFSAHRPLGLCKGNPTTFGQQAELNARRVGKERMAQMAEEAKIANRPFERKLGDGQRRLERAEGPTPFWDADDGVDVTKVRDTKKYIEEGRA
jgi:putative FmdB family regulatory protein